MEAGSGFNFPNMEKHSCELEWSFFEDQAQRCLEFAVNQHQEQMIEQDVDFKLNALRSNSIVQNPTNNNPSTITQLHKDECNADQLLEHDLGADFDLWNENPLLYSEDPWASQLSIPDPLFTAVDSAPFFSNHNHSSSSSLSHFSDQTLDAVVQEGRLKMMKSSESEGSVHVISENKQAAIKSNENYSIYYKQKVSKMEMLKYEEIRNYFDLPISMAAKELNVGITVLKKRCRELNIKKWPHRKIKSLKALISNVKEMGMAEVAELLEEQWKKIQVLPDMELSMETKKLRQACFKVNYKKRRALASL